MTEEKICSVCAGTTIDKRTIPHTQCLCLNTKKGEDNYEHDILLTHQEK